MRLRDSLLIVLLVCCLYAVHANATNRRTVWIHNDTPSRAHLYWIHNGTAVRVNRRPLRPSKSYRMNSTAGHLFEVRQVPSRDDVCHEARTNASETGIQLDFSSAPPPCGQCQITIPYDQESQRLYIRPDWTVDYHSHWWEVSKRPDFAVKECRRRLGILRNVTRDQRHPANALLECVEGELAHYLDHGAVAVEYAEQSEMLVGSLLETYTCSDPNALPSPNVESRLWYPPSSSSRAKDVNQTALTVHVKLNRPAVRIHVIDNFIRPDECRAIVGAAANLTRAQVGDGHGGTEVSDHRRAMVERVSVPWEEEENDHPMARLSRRVLDYVNDELGMNFTEHGQEPLKVVQYYGKEYKNNSIVSTDELDQFKSHADGKCLGRPVAPGKRVATMIMYCAIAEEGGYTNFAHAHVRVNPSLYSALFFNYINPQTNVMDTHLAEHAGCPVVRGIKTVVAQWMRFGVSADVPYSMYNTLGVLDDPFPSDEQDAVGDEHNDMEDQS
jgi:hypothetical protein